MDLNGRHIVVTGAGSGIGRALAHRFAREEPRGLIVSDIDADAARRVAAEIGAGAVAADVGREQDVLDLIAEAERAHGPIDLFCSNAGLSGPEMGPEADDSAWQLLWNVNVMAHVWAARALIPAMVERGEGYLLNTASAAGLLMNLGFMPYSVTKHAAVAVAEYLSAEYGDAGVRVSCLCPQGVATPMLEAAASQMGGRSIAESGSLIQPEEVAEIVLRGIADERFLILSHPEAQKYVERRAADRGRWLAGMRRLRTRSAELEQPRG